MDGICEKNGYSSVCPDADGSGTFLFVHAIKYHFALCKSYIVIICLCSMFGIFTTDLLQYVRGIQNLFEDVRSSYLTNTELGYETKSNFMNETTNSYNTYFAVTEVYRLVFVTKTTDLLV